MHKLNILYQLLHCIDVFYFESYLLDIFGCLFNNNEWNLHYVDRKQRLTTELHVTIDQLAVANLI